MNQNRDTVNKGAPYAARDLGYQGRVYVRERLSDVRNRALGSLLLNYVEFSAGVATSFVPVTAHQDKVIEFVGGPGLLQDMTRPYLEQRICVFLSKYENGVVVCDEVYSTKKTLYMGEFIKTVPLARVKFCNEEVYPFCAESDPLVINQMCRLANGYLCFGILASSSDMTKWVTTSDVPLADLEEVARNVEHIFVTAYDEEGFVIWSKDGSPLG